MHDTGVDEGIPYLVMEYVRGQPLDVLVRKGPMSLEAVRGIVEQVADALEVIHARGVVHRDIKPGNILVGAGDDGALTVKLADFGVAAITGPGLAVEPAPGTTGNLVVGTPGYMSPEQRAGAPADSRSDIWSLAVVAQEALRGMRPEVAMSAASDGEASTDLPSDAAAWFVRALATHPGERFASAREMARAFCACSSSSPGASIAAISADVREPNTEADATRPTQRDADCA